MRTIRMFLAVAMAAGLLAVMAPAASAAGCLDLVQIQFDSPGDDNYTNESLNNEFVKIRNNCAKERKLGGWTISDEDSLRFTFPKFKLGKGKSVIVHTGVGTKNKNNVYVGDDNYIWNNGSDTAFLRKKSGALTGRCAYDSTDPGGAVIC